MNDGCEGNRLCQLAAANLNTQLSQSGDYTENPCQAYL